SSDSNNDRGMQRQSMQQTKAAKPQLGGASLEGNPNSKVTLSDIQRSWKDILERFKARRAMIIYASILTGKPVSCVNGIVTIQYEEQYRFNKDRLDKADNKKIINEVFAEIFRDDIKVAFLVDESGNNEKSTEEQLLETLGSGLVDFLDE
ncbi:MAG: DNA polymerase III subunit gamma/tau, partial [Clostridium sp.]